MKKIISVSFSLILLGLAGRAGAVNSLVFTTSPQAVAVGAASGPLTVSSGEAPGETSDLYLTSTSPTGEFSSSASNWESVTKITWNSNWSNRTFYYRDSASGHPTLTARLLTRTSQQSWTASQAVTVGAGGPPAEDSDSANLSAEADSDLGEAYSSAASLSKASAAKAAKPLVIDPGRRRLVAVGIPLNFKAKVAGGDGTNRDLLIQWSFGDGEAALGREVTHAYYFPGTYIVMVNAVKGDDEAVGQVKVEVVEPQAMVGEIGLAPRPYVQIVNRSPKELNLGYWQLRAGDKALTLPADTLIAGNAKINIPVDPAKIPLATAPAIALAYPNGQVIDSKPLTSEPAAPAPNELKTLVEQLNKALVKKPRPAAVSNSPKPVPAAPAVPVTAAPAPVSKPPAARQVLVLPKAESAWSRVINKLF